MDFSCSFYQDTDFDPIEKMILDAYQWEYPLWSLSRHEFTRGLHPAFTGFHNAWPHTVGVFRERGAIAACVINEGKYDGEQFFLFDSPERAQNKELLAGMIRFAKTYGAGIGQNRKTRSANVFVPQWNTVLAEMLAKNGFTKSEQAETHLILPFPKAPFPIALPEGYAFANGRETPAFFLSNVHRHAFAYGTDSSACDHGAQAFAELRGMKHYRSDLDLCVLDPQGLPVAFALIWHDEKMPYCELEPLAVVWWERRKGLGTTLLHELSNRVMRRFPACTGMLGGDQTFYSRIGYEKKAETPCYHWETDVFISWDKVSFDKDYKSEVQIRTT